MSEETEQVEAAPVDLAAQQTERVSTVADAILGDLGTLLIPEDGVTFDLAPLELATIQHLLDGDLNITTEVPMAFQYVMSGFTGLSQVLADCTFHESHTQEDYAHAAREILVILAKAGTALGDTATAAAGLQAAKEELEALFATEQLSSIDMRYIMSSIVSTFQTLQNGVEKSVEESMERAQAKSFGVQSVQDVTMSKIDTYLKS